MSYIKWFEECDRGNLPQTGGKAANLGELVQKGFDVPHGFCILTSAYHAYVEMNRLNEVIFRECATTATDDLAALEAASMRIRKAFLAGTIPAEIIGELSAAYASLCDDTPTLDADSQIRDGRLPVAVRSSATAEDLDDASFAGQQDTYLNIHGLDAVLLSVMGCWASLWTARAIGYRVKEGIDPRDVELAVVIQEMVPSEVSGILFTANPVTDETNETLIDASWGIGEAIVGGLVTPDHFVLEKSTGRVKETRIADKLVMTVLLEEGSEERPVPLERRSIPALTDRHLEKLNALAVGIERHYQKPMDIEWALYRDKMLILQARPITTLRSPTDAPDLLGVEWSRKDFVERFPDPLTPFTWSTLKELFPAAISATFKAMGIRMPESKAPLVNKLYERFYINDTMFTGALRSLPFPVPGTSDRQIGKEESSRSSIRQKITTIARIVGLLFATHKEWEALLPSIRKRVKEESALPWEAMAPTALLEGLARHEGRLAIIMANHVKSVTLAQATVQILNSLCGKWFPNDKDQLAVSLLSGFSGNVTIETNQALWRLAETARADGALAHSIQLAAGEEWRQGIVRSSGGENFLFQLDAFLEEFGHRSMRYELSYPCWKEQPQQVLDMLKLFLSSAGKGPLESEKQKIDERLGAEKRCIESLPMHKRILFKFILGKTQAYFRLRENQQFFATMENPLLRRIILSLGNRLCDAGYLEKGDDVFFLEKKEIIALSKNPDSMIVSIRERKARYRASFAFMPDLHLGGDKQESILAREGSMRGIPASQGIATGDACIILGPEDFWKIQKGVIIVARTTSPAWTPLFGIAAGLVTDYGGILSHAGVVAREYGIPAVLGVSCATSIFKDGEKITVNGGTGEAFQC